MGMELHDYQWIVNCKRLERKLSRCNLRINTCNLKITKPLSKTNRSPCRDTNTVSSKYGMGMQPLTVEPWYVTPCSICGDYQRFGGKQYLLPKSCFPQTWSVGFAIQKDSILTRKFVKISNSMFILFIIHFFACANISCQLPSAALLRGAGLLNIRCYLCRFCDVAAT
jgi:hypothetical protein